MEDLEILNKAMETWLQKDPDNRHIVSITGDKKTLQTSCGMGGDAQEIACAVANEMYGDPELAFILMTACKAYTDLKEEEIKDERKKVVKKNPKMYS